MGKHQNHLAGLLHLIVLGHSPQSFWFRDLEWRKIIGIFYQLPGDGDAVRPGITL